jgi:hypothetical protein
MIRTKDETVAEIIRLEIVLSKMMEAGEPHNKTSPVLRKIQKLRDQL